MSVDVPAPVTEVGANEAVVPEGSPVALSATLPEKPPTMATVTVLVPELPALSANVVGDTDTVNPASTTRTAGKVFEILPLVAVMLKL